MGETEGIEEADDDREEGDRMEGYKGVWWDGGIERKDCREREEEGGPLASGGGEEREMRWVVSWRA